MRIRFAFTIDVDRHRPEPEDAREVDIGSVSENAEISGMYEDRVARAGRISLRAREEQGR